MKHPNKKIENANKFKSKCRIKSCFNYWIGIGRGHGKSIPLTHDLLVEALRKIKAGLSN